MTHSTRPEEEPHQSERFISRSLIIDRLLWIQTAAWFPVVLGILFYGYRQQHWSEVQVFQINDGWCDTGQQGIGQHCFGDFGLPYNRGLQSSPYTPGNPAAANTPLTAFVFELFRLMSYNIGLFIYLGLLTLCLLWPFINAKSEVDLRKRVQLGVLFGLISAGGIAVLDRGNHVAVFVPLLVGYLIALEKGRWKSAVALLVLMSMLKFWGFVFVLALIARSKFRHATLALAIAGTASALILTWFPGSFRESLSAMLRSAGDRTYANQVSAYSISIQGLIRRLQCLSQGANGCNTEIQEGLLVASPFLSLAVLVLLLIMVYVFLKSEAIPSTLSLSALVSIGFLAVPEAPIYQASLVSCVVVLLAVMPENQYSAQWTRSFNTLVFAVFISSLPLTFFVQGPFLLASSHNNSDYQFRSYYWTIPLVWFLFFASIGLDYRQQLSRNRPQLKPKVK